jgi:3D (Asp-Asp-Asp) domain-containing protein
LIGRSPIKAVLAFSVLAAGLLALGFTTYPSAVRAESLASRPVAHVVSFTSNGSTTEHVTSAQTVGTFLRERGIVAGPNDFVAPGLDTPLSDKLSIQYRAAVGVDVVVDHQTQHYVSAAPTVAALLAEQHVTLQADDQVVPALDRSLSANQIVRILHVNRWTRAINQSIAAQTIHRIVYSMPVGQTKVLANGHSGLRETTVRFTQVEGGNLQKHVVTSRIVRKPQPRIVAEGIDEFDAFQAEHAGTLDKASYVAQSQMLMVATAYTASCYGCSGITATGHRAGHGIIAVDPRVIRLGTKLYIPGYGVAIAGDTGGAIRGNRIDLGFNSLSDAVRFGRRVVAVYRLK